MLEIVKLALPPLSVTGEPTLLESTWNWIVPVGPLPEEGVTVTVKVTDWP
jgi:hypothetical protein